MKDIQCEFPQFLKDKDPCKCSCEQMRKCHELSGGKHPLPTKEQIKAEQEQQEKG